jgi:hypothetical protein
MGTRRHRRYDGNGQYRGETISDDYYKPDLLERVDNFTTSVKRNTLAVFKILAIALVALIGLAMLFSK